MNTNGPDLAVPDIFRESDSYYLIGFRPADPGANGKFHQITVKTTRHGLDVRARSGYTAPTAVVPANSSNAASSVGTRAGGVDWTVAGRRDAARRERRGVCRSRHTERGRRADGRRERFRVSGSRRRPGISRRSARDRDDGVRHWRPAERHDPAGTGAPMAGSRGDRRASFRRHDADRSRAWRVRGPNRGVRCRAHGERLLVCDGAGVRGCSALDLEHRGRCDRGNAECTQRFPRAVAADRADSAARVRPHRSVPCVLQDLPGNRPARSALARTTAIDSRRRPWSRWWPQRRARSTQGSSQPIARPTTTSPSRSRRWRQATTS